MNNTEYEIKMCKTMVQPVVVCGSGVWAMTEMDMKRLGTWEGKILRRKYRSLVKQGMWGIRTNEELKDGYKDIDVVADVKRSDWNGLDM